MKINYIENLASNYKIPDKPILLDIIIEGGALNIYNALGSLKLVKELENKNYFKVNRISGTSAGSLLGTLFLLNRLDILEEMYKDFKKNYIINSNFSALEDYVKNITNEVTDEEFDLIKDNRMYITYFNTDDSKQIIKSNYSNKFEFQETLLKSCHIPYMTNGNETYIDSETQSCNLDGCYPYVFKDVNNKVLYISLINFLNLDTIKTIFTSKNENNMEKRIMSGALDTHNFLLFNKKNRLCSYLNNWSKKDFLILRIKQFIMINVIFIGLSASYVYSMIRPLLQNIDIYNKYEDIVCNLGKDIIYYYNN